MKMPALAPVALLAACATPQPNVVPATALPQTTAQSVAEALAEADRAAAAGDERALGTSLARLDGLGARADEGEPDVLAAWQVRLGRTPQPYRGRALGPAYRRGSLPADGEVRLSQTFLSGQRASIAVSSPGRPVPGLSVTSASGRAVCESAAHCRWTPVFTERYEIVLRNPARRASDYYLVVE